MDSPAAWSSLGCSHVSSVLVDLDTTATVWNAMSSTLEQLL